MLVSPTELSEVNSSVRQARPAAAGIVVSTLLVLAAGVHAHRTEPGAGALMLWPSARSIALAGAMTGLADDADGAYFNPAGPAFRNTTCLNLNYGHWLPKLIPGMRYANASFATPLRRRLGPFRNLSLGANVTWLDIGETELFNERGEYLGRALAWRGAAGFTGSALIDSNLSVGLGFKVFHSQHAFDDVCWVEPPHWWDYTPGSYLGLEYGGDATTIEADLGMLWQVGQRLSLGASFANLGPGISYKSYYPPGWDSTYAATQPTMARLGLGWTPVETELLRLAILPEFTKVLPGTGESYPPKRPWRVQDELNDLWKSLGIELSVLDVVSLRAGYFEDLTRCRGGVRVEREGGLTSHISLWEFLTSRDPGSFKSIGICWGFGLGYQNLLRLDVSNDGAIYHWSESNWRFSLVSNDPAGLVARLRRIAGW